MTYPSIGDLYTLLPLQFPDEMNKSGSTYVTSSGDPRKISMIRSGSHARVV